MPLEEPIDLVYSTTPWGHEIGLSLWVPRGVTGPLPVIISWHGGGLTNGSRYDLYFKKDVAEDILANGYILISPDYRLLTPSTSLDQIADTSALMSYLSSTSFADALPSGVTADLKRVGLMGFSAGGLMASWMATEWLSKKPEGIEIKGIVGYYSMGGSQLNDYWIKPTPTFQGVPPVSEAQVAPFLISTETSSAPVAVFPPAPDSRGLLFRYLYQTKSLIDQMTGLPGLTASLAALPESERAAAIPESLRPVFPEIFLAQDPRAKDFPPTLLIHGDADILIELKESEATEKSLKALGVECELVVVKGGGHGFIKPMPEITFIEESFVVDKKAVKFLVDRV